MFWEIGKLEIQLIKVKASEKILKKSENNYYKNWQEYII